MCARPAGFTRKTLLSGMREMVLSTFVGGRSSAERWNESIMNPTDPHPSPLPEGEGVRREGLEGEGAQKFSFVLSLWLWAGGDSSA